MIFMFINESYKSCDTDYCKCNPDCKDVNIWERKMKSLLLHYHHNLWFIINIELIDYNNKKVIKSNRINDECSFN